MSWKKLPTNSTPLIGPSRMHCWAFSKGSRTALVWPQEHGEWIWTVNSNQANGQSTHNVEQTCVTFEEAKELAEAELNSVRPLGRPPKQSKAMPNGERSKRRMGRLLAAETSSNKTRKHLMALHQDLRNSGMEKWARRVAVINRAAALTAAAEYTRRNSSIFVQDGPKSFNAKEFAARRDHIATLADEIDALADTSKSTYAQFEATLRKLHKLGFYLESDLVSEVALSFVNE